MNTEIFEAALGITSPWFIADMDFDEQARSLTIRIDFERGSRFEVPDAEGTHPVHETVTKRYRHLDFFQCECVLEVRLARWIRRKYKSLGRSLRKAYARLRKIRSACPQLFVRWQSMYTGGMAR